MRKKLVKQIVALLAAFVMMTGIDLPAPVQASGSSGETEVANADFDGVFFNNPIFERWNGAVPTGSEIIGAKVEKVQETTDSGLIQALRLSDDTGSTSATYIQNIIQNMETGKTYEISFDARFEGAGSAHFSVHERQASAYVQLFQKYCTTELKNGWTRLSYTFEAAYSTNLFRWRILDPDKASAYYITNVRLRIVGQGELISNGSFNTLASDGSFRDWYPGMIAVSDRGSNLLSNGSFEKEKATTGFTAEGWNLRTGNAEGAVVTTETKNVADGEKALKMTWATGDPSLEVGMGGYGTFEKSTTYNISFKAKTTDTIMYLETYLYVKNAKGTADKIGLETIRTTDNDWKQMTYTYTTADEDLLESENFLLCFKMGNYPATVYIDDVQIYKKGSGADTPQEVSVKKATVTGIDGVTIANNGGYIQTLTTKQTRTDATYILKMNTALTGTGKGRLWINERANSTVLLDTFVTGGSSATEQKYLITPKVAATCTVRFQVWEDWAADTAFSVGNVTMYMNRGDFDEDGEVTEDDLKAMRKALVGDTGVSDTEVLPYIDLTADGEGTVTDLIRMKWYASGRK